MIWEGILLLSGILNVIAFTLWFRTASTLYAFDTVHNPSQLAEESFPASPPQLEFPSRDAMNLQASFPQLDFANRDTMMMRLVNRTEGGCRNECCVNLYRRERYFDGTNYEGLSKNNFRWVDFVSVVGWKHLADIVVDSGIPRPTDADHVHWSSAFLPCLQNGTVFHVDNGAQDAFFRDIHPQLRIEYILITGDTDNSSPIPSGQQYLNDPKLLHWFGQNCIIPSNSKFTCVHIGLSQWGAQRAAMQAFFARMFDGVTHFRGLSPGHMGTAMNNSVDLLGRSRWNESGFLFQARFSLPPNRPGRLNAHKALCSNNSAMRKFTECSYSYGESFEHVLRLYEEMAKIPLVVAPPGQGADAYRTWETLLVGGVPIIRKGNLDPIYDSMPILSIENDEEWGSALNSLDPWKKKYEDILARRYKFDYRPLFLGYWQQRLDAYKPSHFKGTDFLYQLASIKTS